MIRRVPFTLLFVTALVVANGLAGTFDGRLPPQALKAWGLSLDSLLDGELFRLITATFLSHSLTIALRQIAFAAAIIGAYEWRHGTRRAIVMFVAVDVIGTLLVFACVIAPLARADGGLDTELAGLSDVGMSAGGFGLIGALCRDSRTPWLALCAVGACIGVKMILSLDVIADSAHLICLGLSFAFQRLLTRRCTGS